MNCYASEQDYTSTLREVLLIANKYDALCRSTVSGQHAKTNDYYIFKTTLHRGNRYFIIGLGESSIRDLDIILLDDKRTVVARDVETEAEALISVDPKKTGTFYIATLMYTGKKDSNSSVTICSQEIGG